MTLHQLLLFSARLKTLQAAGPKGEGGLEHMTLHQLLLFTVLDLKHCRLLDQRGRGGGGLDEDEVDMVT